MEWIQGKKSLHTGQIYAPEEKAASSEELYTDFDFGDGASIGPGTSSKQMWDETGEE